MIVVGNEDRNLLDEMFRLRARVFHDRLHWGVDVVYGMERDMYDDLRPIYILDVDGSVVRGSLRLLPTTGSTFSELVFPSEMVSAPTIWECSRLCVDDSSNMADVASNLLIAVGRLSVDRGIETIIASTYTHMVFLCRVIGFDVQVLGKTDRFGKRVFLCAARMDAETIDRIENGQGKVHRS